MSAGTVGRYTVLVKHVGFGIFWVRWFRMDSVVVSGTSFIWIFAGEASDLARRPRSSSSSQLAEPRKKVVDNGRKDEDAIWNVCAKVSGTRESEKW
jgi:hypothetical protein